MNQDRANPYKGNKKVGSRKQDARSIDSVCATIGRLLERFTPAECSNYFANSGYASA
jgi:hypothetical protein